MHMVISVVVEAHDMDGAVRAAEQYFDQNLSRENGGPFDYCQAMTGGHTVAGSDRWAHYQDKDIAFPVDSESGQEQIEDAWESTVTRAKQNMRDVWDAMEQSFDFQDFFEQYIMQEEDLIRYKMSNVGGYQSTDYFLYVQGWSSSGVRSRRGYDYLQDEIVAREQERDEDEWWVVPLDVHY